MKSIQSNETSSNKSPAPKKKGPGTAIIAVTAVTAFLSGSVGYELVKHQKTAAPQTLNIFPNQLAAISLDSLQGNQNGYNIRLLNEKNRQQAERIKELQKELAELNHNFHDYKLSLFSRSNPVDVAQIQTLTKELESKSKVVDKLSQQIRQFETLASKGDGSLDAEQQKAIHALVEEAEILGDIKDILHAQLSREAEQQLLSHLNELQALQHAANQTRLSQEEVAQDLATLVELDKTLSLLKIEKNAEKIAKISSVYDRKIAFKDNEIQKATSTLDEVVAKLNNLNTAISVYAQALIASEALRAEQQVAFEQKQTDIKAGVQAVKARHSETIAKLNQALQNEKSQSGSLYAILEAQNHFLLRTFNTFDSKDNLLSNTLGNYDNTLNKLHRLEQQKKHLEQAIASYDDVMEYQHYSHSVQNQEHSQKLTSTVAAYQDVLDLQDQEIRELKEENEHLLLAVASYHDTLNYTQTSQNSYEKELNAVKEAHQATSNQINERANVLQEQNAKMRTALQVQKARLEKNITKNKALVAEAAVHNDYLTYQQQCAEQQTRALETANQKIKELTETANSLKTQLAEYRLATSQQTQNLANREAVISKLYEKLALNEKAQKTLEARASQLNVDVLDRDHQLSLLNDELVSSAQQKKEISAKLARAIQGLSDSKQQNKQLSDELNRTVAALSQAENRNNTHAASLKLKERELRSAIEAETTIRQHLIEQIAQLQTNIDLLTAEREVETAANYRR